MGGEAAARARLRALVRGAARRGGPRRARRRGGRRARDAAGVRPRAPARSRLARHGPRAVPVERRRGRRGTAAGARRDRRRRARARCPASPCRTPRPSSRRPPASSSPVADWPSSSRGSARCRGRSTASFTRRTAGSGSIRGARFPGPTRPSFDGDAALPWRIVRDAGEADWRRFGLGPPRVRRLNAFAYLLSLGFRQASLLPLRLAGAAQSLDRWTAPLAPLTALRAFLGVGQVARGPAFRTMLKPRLDSWTVARIVAPLVSFVPFVYGLARGGSFYFRDLSSYFFPIRRFVAEGLRAGEIRHWNPYVNEGIPVVLPPVAYPIDLLQALRAERVGLLTAARAARPARRAHLPGPGPSAGIRPGGRDAGRARLCPRRFLAVVREPLHPHGGVRVGAARDLDADPSPLRRSTRGHTCGRRDRLLPVDDRGRDRGPGGRLRLRAVGLTPDLRPPAIRRQRSARCRTGGLAARDAHQPGLGEPARGRLLDRGVARAIPFTR